MKFTDQNGDPVVDEKLELQLKQQLVDATVKALWAILLMVTWPIVAIWAINELFGTVIPVTFWTWLSVMLLRTAVTPFPTPPKEKLTCLPKPLSQTKN